MAGRDAASAVPDGVRFLVYVCTNQGPLHLLVVCLPFAVWHTGALGVQILGGGFHELIPGGVEVGIARVVTG